MQIQLTSDLKNLYPESIFGSLIIRNFANIKSHDTLEERKRDLERKIKEGEGEVERSSMIKKYDSYFKQWKKTYPIEFQIKTIKAGRRFPKVSALVDVMFLAELNSCILTSGHDLDKIQGNLTFDVSSGGENYLKLNNQEQKLKQSDVILNDEEGLLASILYGPAKRTSITMKAKNALYFAWCPYITDEGLIKAHLNEILSYISNISETITSEIRLIRS